jgi:hypothetical protein
VRTSLFRGGFALLLLAGLVLCGCGSSSSSSSTTTAAISKAEFLKKANTVCKKGNQKINKVDKSIFETNKKPTKAQEMQFATGTLIPGIQEELDGIKALGAPKGDEAKVNQIVTTAQDTLDKIKNDPTILFTSSTDPFKAANKLSNAYGLTVCGAGGGNG